MKKIFKNNETGTIVKLNKEAYKEAFKELSFRIVQEFHVDYGKEKNAWLQGCQVYVERGQLNSKNLHGIISLIKNDTIVKASFNFYDENHKRYNIKYTKKRGFKVPKLILTKYFTKDVRYFQSQYNADVILKN